MSWTIENFKVDVYGDCLVVDGLHRVENVDHSVRISLHDLATGSEVQEIGDQLEAIFGPLREKARRMELQRTIDEAKLTIERAEERLRAVNDLSAY